MTFVLMSHSRRTQEVKTHTNTPLIRVTKLKNVSAKQAHSDKAKTLVR